MQTNQPNDIEKLSTALGLELLKQMVNDFLGKASGKAPATSNVGGEPAALSSTHGLPASAPATSLPAANVASVTPDGSKATQQVSVVQGAMAPQTGAVGPDTTLGQPVMKSTIDDFLKRVEAQAVNKDAVDAARGALNAAFEAPEAEEAEAPEADMANVEELIQETVIKGLDPIVDAIGSLEERLDRIEGFLSSDEDDAPEVEVEKAKGKKKAPVMMEPDGDENEETMKAVLKALSAINSRLESVETRRQPVIKSRVPSGVDARTPASDAGVWTGSPFETAARQ